MRGATNALALGGALALVGLLGGCKSVAEHLVLGSHQEIVVDTNPVQLRLIAQVDALTAATVPGGPDDWQVKNVHLIRAACAEARVGLVLIDDAANKVLYLRMLTDRIPSHLPDAAERARQRESAGRASFEASKKTNWVWMQCSSALDDVRPVLKAYQDGVSQPGVVGFSPELVAYTDQIAQLERSLSEFTLIWQSLVAQPTADILATFETSDAATELGITGAVEVAREKANVVLDRIAEIRGKRFEFTTDL
ncbi:MAG: hypothetical protein K8S98_06425 [Planctomycetes bacterium]|nr:hypothetical protein [Planctomycetota bacterium]